MQPDAISRPTYYNGVFRHGVDEKRRVQIPAKWRPEEGTELTLVLWPKAAEGPCLRVLLPQQMADLMRDITGLPNTDPNKGILKRVVGTGSVQVTLDKSGRICVPEEMARGAGITDQAVFTGCLDRFEIWSPERYERVQAADAVHIQDAFKLME